MPNGTVRQKLHDEASKITTTQRLQWACEAAEALQVLHSNNVVHCDVYPENFMLDCALRLRIIDFSGSSIDGKWHSAMDRTRFCLPRSWEEQSIVVTDIFALGSTIYEIMTGKAPYEALSDEEVEYQFKARIFPGVETRLCGEVIKGCWCGDIKSAGEAETLIKAESKKGIGSLPASLT